MNETEFCTRRAKSWEAWDRWLSSSSGAAQVDDGGEGHLEALPSAFRSLCHDLSLARDRQYSRSLQDALHARVLRVHQRIYSASARRPVPVLGFFLDGFPRLVRDEWRAVLLACVLLFGSLGATLVAVQVAPTFAHVVLPASVVGDVEAMYAPTAEHLGRPRAASTEWGMWGFYVANNVRIDFQCFAGGVAFGVGAAFFLLYNGLFIGAVAGHLTHLGYIETFWGFVAGHSALELVGAALSGAAGLVIGGALVSPGRRSRTAAVKARGGVAVRLLAGAAVMTFLAAFIEAFWSPTRAVPVGVKYGVGVVGWILVVAYFVAAGRGRRAA